jgi:hypothetical protein
MSAGSRRLRAYLLARAKRQGGRLLGRRATWGPEHEEAFAERLRRARRDQTPPEGRR